MPRNAAGVPIRPDEYNRNDGFSPGSPIHTFVPGPRLRRRIRPCVPITDMARAFDADQPAVVIDADTGERQLIWAEMDANAKTDADAQPLSSARAATGRRATATSSPCATCATRTGNASSRRSPPFRAYRDKDRSHAHAAVDPRREHMDELFKTLNKAGIKRKDLYLAWDFTVGSERAHLRAMLGIRDDAFAALGDTDLADCRSRATRRTFTGHRRCIDDAERPAQIIRAVRRHVHRARATSTLPGCPPGLAVPLHGPDSNTPTRIPGNMAAPTSPASSRAAVDRTVRGAASLYGHGLFGSQSEVDRRQRQDDGRTTTTSCSARRTGAGWRQQDVPTRPAILGDLSNFALAARPRPAGDAQLPAASAG